MVITWIVKILYRKVLVWLHEDLRFSKLQAVQIEIEIRQISASLWENDRIRLEFNFNFHSSEVSQVIIENLKSVNRNKISFWDRILTVKVSSQ